MKTIKYIIVLVSLIAVGCMKHEDLNLEINHIVPREINDGLSLKTPEDLGISSLELMKIYEEIDQDPRLWPIRSMLVFKNSHLIAEHYFKNESDITETQLMWSCTKQVIGLLTGIAIEKNIIEDIDDTVGDHLPKYLEETQDKADITVKELLTMTSGIDYENDGPFGETHQLLLQKPDDITRFILERPNLHAPSSTFHYKDSDPQLLAAIIQSTIKKPLDEWADEVLFDKIKIDNYNWDRYKDGQTLGGFGLILTPRQLGKIALLVSNEGKHQGEQIVSKSWIQEMTSPQILRENKQFSFGYMWWLDNNSELVFMWGHGGQFAFIDKASNIVVVISSIPNTQGSAQISADEILTYIYNIVDL